MIRFDTKKDMEHYDNLYHQIIEKDKQLDKYKNVIDKIKEYINKEISLIDKDLSECELTYSEKYNFENAKNKYINILELLEEVE